MELRRQLRSQMEFTAIPQGVWEQAKKGLGSGSGPLHKKRMNTISSSKPKLFSTLGQICKLIPVHLVPKLARETGAAQKARAFTRVATGPH
jgi:hypothetical protein